jgi:hypothetical protein
MLLLHSVDSNHSQHVLREIELAIGRGLPILPVSLVDVEPSRALGYFIRIVQRLLATTPPLEAHLPSLLEKIRALLDSGAQPLASYVSPADHADAAEFGPITGWLGSVERLKVQGQISLRQQRRALKYVIGAESADQMSPDDLRRRLSAHPDWKRRILYGDFDETSVSETILRRNVPPDVQQVRIAVAADVPVSMEIVGIRFVLVPPGTSVTGLVNRDAFYLSESAISETEWAAIMDPESSGQADSRRARTHVSVQKANAFLKTARSSMPSGLELSLPTIEQWSFALSLGPTAQPEAAISPTLRSTDPSAIGLRDLLGVVWQFCRTRTGYELCGGSYLRPLLSPTDEPPSFPCQNNSLDHEDAGLRLAITLRT